MMSEKESKKSETVLDALRQIHSENDSEAAVKLISSLFLEKIAVYVKGQIERDYRRRIDPEAIANQAIFEILVWIKKLPKTDVEGFNSGKLECTFKGKAERILSNKKKEHSRKKRGGKPERGESVFGENPFGDCTPYDTDPGRSVLAEDFIKTLNSRERKILELYNEHSDTKSGIPWGEIGAKLGLTAKQAQHKFEQIKEKYQKWDRGC